MCVNMIRLLLFTAALCGTVVLTTDWSAVENDVKILWDLERKPLHIKASKSSKVGSGKKITVSVYDKDSSFIGGVSVMFSSPMQYWIGWCSDWTDLPVQPPAEVKNIWTITKTETGWIIACNNVEVLNYLFADSSDSRCVPNSGGDVVEEIKFENSASDFYSAEPHCPSFTVEGSTKGNWAASQTGTTATIKCAANHILVGSATLTCQEYLSWSSDIPQCIDWSAVENDVKILWDLERKPLHIKASKSSKVGSGKKITVSVYDKDSSFIGGVSVMFSSPMQYWIGWCSDWTDLPVQPPAEVKNIWTITKTETGWIIACNNVEVLNYLFADSSDSRCVPNSGGDVVEEIKFENSASDFYSAEPHCPSFTVEGSTKGNWAASQTGTTATIKCAANHILVGSATLTCQEYLSWSSDIPQCIGKNVSVADPMSARPTNMQI
eukprot:sb/3464817/